MEDNEEAIYLLKKILFTPELFVEIYKNYYLKNLKKTLKNYIFNIFPKNFSRVIEKCIVNNNFKDLLNLLTIISYIRQFNQNLNNFEVTMKYIIVKTDLIQFLEFDEDLLPLIAEIQAIGEIGDNLIKYIFKIISEKKNNEINLIKYIEKLKIVIKTIEENINLFEENPVTKNSIFFPELDDLRKNLNKILFEIPRFWLSFIFLEYYIMAILRMFFRNTKLNELTNTIIIFNALNFKSIDIFKNNFFYRIGDNSSEYWIKLNFLENFTEIILYLFYIKKKVIPLLKNKNDDELIWKSIFEKYIIKLNERIESFIEDTLQFIPSTKSNIEIYVRNLEKTILDILNQVDTLFMGYLLNNYKKWVLKANDNSTPLNVVNALKRKFFTNYLSGLNKFNLFLFIDCCHLGIWNILKQKILNDFPNLYIQTEIGYSILPTLTKYARAALFSGDYPRNIQSNNELKEFLRQSGKPTSKAYIEEMKNHFITNCENMYDFKENINNIKNTKENFQISVFNFSDKTSHTYSQNFLKTLINSIYNSKIRPLIELISRSYKEIFIFFATDHGCSRCTEQFDWKNDKFNRYWENDIFHKKGARTFISYEIPPNIDDLSNKMICIKHTEASSWGLPSNRKLPKSYILKELNYFFANNCHNFKKTPENKRNLENFGHGGATMDEFIIPFAIIKEKKQDFIEFNWKIDIEFFIEKTPQNSHTYKILIRNNSNKEIIFYEGHLITEFIHHKFILQTNYNLSNNDGLNERILKFRFPEKYLQKEAHFYFTFFQDEKREISKIYYARTSEN